MMSSEMSTTVSYNMSSSSEEEADEEMNFTSIFNITDIENFTSPNNTTNSNVISEMSESGNSNFALYSILCIKGFIFGSIIILAVLGNALVILAVRRNRKLRYARSH